MDGVKQASLEIRNLQVAKIGKINAYEHFFVYSSVVL